MVGQRGDGYEGGRGGGADGGCSAEVLGLGVNEKMIYK